MTKWDKTEKNLVCSERVSESESEGPDETVVKLHFQIKHWKHRRDVHIRHTHILLKNPIKNAEVAEHWIPTTTTTTRGGRRQDPPTPKEEVVLSTSSVLADQEIKSIFFTVWLL